MYGFSYYNVQFKKHNVDNCAVVVGEITNETTRDYNTAVFRISVFERQQLIANGFIKIKGFKRKRTKSFETALKELPYNLLPQNVKYDIQFESGY